jgi:hypothetical protein
MKKSFLLSTCLCFSVMSQQTIYGVGSNNPLDQETKSEQAAVAAQHEVGRPTQIPTQPLVTEFHDVGYTAQDVMDEVESVLK